MTRLTSCSASSRTARGSRMLGWSGFSGVIVFLSREAAEPPQGHGTGGEEHQQPRAGEPGGHLLLLGRVTELRAEAVVDLVEMGCVADREGLAAGGLGHRFQRRGVGRHVLDLAL